MSRGDRATCGRMRAADDGWALAQALARCRRRRNWQAVQGAAKSDMTDDVALGCCRV
jgi:hypothetical protein